MIGILIINTIYSNNNFNTKRTLWSSNSSIADYVIVLMVPYKKYNTNPVSAMYFICHINRLTTTKVDSTYLG